MNQNSSELLLLMISHFFLVGLALNESDYFWSKRLKIIQFISHNVVHNHITIYSKYRTVTVYRILVYSSEFVSRRLIDMNIWKIYFRKVYRKSLVWLKIVFNEIFLTRKWFFKSLHLSPLIYSIGATLIKNKDIIKF